MGDKVLSYDERTKTTLYQPVIAFIQGEQRYQLIKLTLDSGDSIETTAEHPFYIKGKGWNPANSLKVGEALQLHNGTTVVIKQIETGIRVEKVYNLTVANTHNYFVGEDGVLVHNCLLSKIRKFAKKWEAILGVLSALAEEGDVARGRDTTKNSKTMGEQVATVPSEKKKKKGSGGDGKKKKKKGWGSHNSHNKNERKVPKKRKKW